MSHSPIKRSLGLSVAWICLGFVLSASALTAFAQEGPEVQALQSDSTAQDTGKEAAPESIEFTAKQIMPNPVALGIETGFDFSADPRLKVYVQGIRPNGMPQTTGVTLTRNPTTGAGHIAIDTNQFTPGTSWITLYSYDGRKIQQRLQVK